MADQPPGGEGFDGELVGLLNEAGGMFFAYDVDDDHRVSFISGRVAQVTGYEPEELVGKSFHELIEAEDWQRILDESPSGALAGDVRVRRIDGSAVWLRLNTRETVRDGMRRVVGFAIEVDSLKRREQVLRTRLEADSLTGLLSREAFMVRLVGALEANPTEVAIGIVDLDSFKQINDTLGHPVGDEVLRIIGQRLARLGVPGVEAARLGGDEFGLLIEGNKADRLQHTGQIVLDKIGESAIIGGIELSMRASVGFGVADAGMTSAELLRRADVAMYEAKRSHHKVALYERASQGDLNADQLTSASRLRRDLESELTLWFQPVIDLWSGETIGVEGLARWEHPERGLLLPSEFLPAIEIGGLNERLDLWAVESAAELGRLQTRSGAPLRLAVNITMDGLRSAQLVPRVRRLIEAGVLRSGQLVLEISERDVQEELSSVQDVLHELRSLGVGLSLDDFGTGYSSLTRLRDLPFSEVKMDASFVRHAHESERDREIVRSTIELSRSLGLSVVAEGVEELATSQVISSLGCSYGQGNFYAHPMDVEDLLRRKIVVPSGSVALAS